MNNRKNFVSFNDYNLKDQKTFKSFSVNQTLDIFLHI